MEFTMAAETKFSTVKSIFWTNDGINNLKDFINPHHTEEYDNIKCHVMAIWS